MAKIILNQISKTYPGRAVPAVHNLNLTIQRGEILTLLGPSGCGKTTALRLIAGFERPDDGTISFDGRMMVDAHQWTPPEKRNVGMVFQDYALFPHLNVEKNIGFGLPAHRDLKSGIERVIECVGLKGLNLQFPHQLSGGQQQRVALGRALIRDPWVVLLDEPFSNLDADFRSKMREEVVEIIRKAKATAVFVTHDQTEALVISDRIAVLNQGQIMQVGTPKEIYRFPENEFVATFIGRTNLISGIVSRSGTAIETGIGTIPCDHMQGNAQGSPVVCSIRPNSFKMHAQGRFSARIVKTVFSGTVIEATAEVEGSGGEHAVPFCFYLQPEEDAKVNRIVRFDILPQFVTVIQQG
jgi:iron(III) transport system ATP-binding protein